MMDPLSALLLALWIAGYCTRNTVQDLAWKARGEDPPSYRRQQERRARRAERAADPGPGRRFWANVWADAVASAEERRERVAERAAEKRRAKWADQDAAAAEDEAYAVNERFREPEETTSSPRDPVATTDHCDTCNAVCEWSTLVTRYVQGYGSLWVCPSCAQKLAAGETVPLLNQNEAEEDNAAAPRRCHFCRRLLPTTDLWPTRTEDGRTVGACPDCWHDRNTHRPDPAADDDSGQEQPSPPADPEPGDAEIIQFADWQRPAVGTIEEENSMSAEITGLRSAIYYANGSARAAEQATVQTETAISNLQAGGTSGASITQLQQAMESLTMAAGQFRAAAETLSNQVQVAEAYAANEGAGTREFVTSE